MAITKEDILEAVGSLTVMELNDLVKAFEEKFGVSAAAVAVGSCDLLQDARPPAIAPEQTTTRDQGARPSIHHISHTVGQRRVVRGFIPLHPCAGASRGRVAITHAHIHSLRRVTPRPKFRRNPFIKAFTCCRIVWLCRLLDTCFTLRSAKGGTV